MNIHQGRWTGSGAGARSADRGGPGSAQQRRRRLARVVAVAELVIGGAALVGGVLLAVRPDGALLAADPAALLGTPFSDWRTPGLLLGILVGGGFLVTGLAEWLERTLAPALSVAAGVALFAFELVQMRLIGWQVLQAIFGLAGLIIAAASIRRAHFAAHQSHRSRTTLRDRLVGALRQERSDDSTLPPSGARGTR